MLFLTKNPKTINSQNSKKSLQFFYKVSDWPKFIIKYIIILSHKESLVAILLQITSMKKTDGKKDVKLTYFNKPEMDSENLQFQNYPKY